jgi:hypothetical protein
MKPNEILEAANQKIEELTMTDAQKLKFRQSIIRDRIKDLTLKYPGTTSSNGLVSKAIQFATKKSEGEPDRVVYVVAAIAGGVIVDEGLRSIAMLQYFVETGEADNDCYSIGHKIDTVDDESIKVVQLDDYTEFLPEYGSEVARFTSRQVVDGNETLDKIEESLTRIYESSLKFEENDSL